MEDLSSLVWPLAFILISLFTLRQFRDDLNPIIKAMISSLSQSASTNAVPVMMAIMFGLSASLSAFWDVFHAMDKGMIQTMSWHQYLAMWTKVLNPFVVAVLAYATQSKFKTTQEEEPNKSQ